MMNRTHLSEPAIAPSEPLKSAEVCDKKRLAVYVRVGQSCDDSVSSCELIKCYYAEYVKLRLDWTLGEWGRRRTVMSRNRVVSVKGWQM